MENAQEEIFQSIFLHASDDQSLENFNIKVFDEFANVLNEINVASATSITGIIKFNIFLNKITIFVIKGLKILITSFLLNFFLSDQFMSLKISHAILNIDHRMNQINLLTLSIDSENNELCRWFTFDFTTKGVFLNSYQYLQSNYGFI